MTARMKNSGKKHETCMGTSTEKLLCDPATVLVFTEC